MAEPKKVKDVLPYISYTASLDVIEVSRTNGNKHLFPACDWTTRKTIEEFYPEILERELAEGIHAEGVRRDRLVIPVKEIDA